ncbi:MULTISPECIES: NAD(P)-dependent oxidoreductase [Streptosporangium]|uniref:3-hydroxyisobutyrate dehydrogenase-like beta-hydroxyacid dehydrogenase n=1 Tax=Streptosporangium brasiliense TaxID=47480 RepID=A0ABT9R8G8_9ACTN|nr:NAD(P)-dependent oxidoreductase [Streptosporangium brasiliense]MDP9864700.1 3-hydroxyisobutyrate dehydrogenase-like beta-hydroxyacid dehydrogenase [Streptosporangium brasiliense]
MHNPHAGQSPVTVIGLGLMGQALAGTFLGNGHPTTVWNRSAEKADELVARGATLAASVRDAVEASPLVIVCVSDYAAAHGLLAPLGDALAGRVLVNLTSGTSEQARESAEWAAGEGVTYLDGAIMAIPPVIGTADAFLLYSGPQDAYDAHEPTLKALGAGTTYLGADHGLASLYDVALLGIMWGTLNSFLHGAALVGTAKVDATVFAPFANRWIEAVTGFVSAYAGQIDEGAYPALDATIDTHVATMDHLIHESESGGVNTELPRLVKALADRAVAEGRGGDGYAAMIEQFRRPSA